jgi:O-antigen/teichoic acid export membrane protein
MTGKSSPLLRATLMLVAGGAAAQALPLLIGPLLTRLYTPAQFGLYQLFAAVAANLAVVACARYEFALPVARDQDEAQGLLALSTWLLLALSLLCGVAGVLWSLAIGQSWPLWLPLAVAALGALSLATLSATRAQRFKALAASRVVQHGGGALGQLGAGLMPLGLTGLIVAPLLSALAALALLRLPLHGWWKTPRARLRAVAHRYRDFPLLNTPHAFAGALQDTLSVALIAATQGPAAAGFWGLALRYLKAPATLVGSAVAQALYPALGAAGAHAQSSLASPEGRRAVRRAMSVLAVLAAVLVLLLWGFGPWLFGWAFGEGWRESGDLARALALYIGVHFVASPLAVVTMAWQAQAWALKLALVGQACFLLALALGLYLGGLVAAGWCVSLAMAAYFGVYFWKLATWPVDAPAHVARAGA